MKAAPVRCLPCALADQPPVSASHGCGGETLRTVKGGRAVLPCECGCQSGAAAKAARRPARV